MHLPKKLASFPRNLPTMKMFGMACCISPKHTLNVVPIGGTCKYSAKEVTKDPLLALCRPGGPKHTGGFENRPAVVPWLLPYSR